ncbi:hypothetical protein Tasa_015_032 [Tanticharoenia sakaeratensis NBRC 103193]|uniref:Uncharacterized protein n=1 Tax=Tanticharoenia sakaeratensis NBRC 103193 TaxID=1231623 RepID=A0A0D6ML89_9PROT|nr:hypothetical protein Tasa_015_032 [Tanticharoenia sakaeratensis NBRC 103193]GBQ23676.1 hypothetical protein AA103193_2496 [Tanticharoenia sakaeratensis NBRC 103193]
MNNLDVQPIQMARDDRDVDDHEQTLRGRVEQQARHMPDQRLAVYREFLLGLSKALTTARGKKDCFVTSHGAPA